MENFDSIDSIGELVSDGSSDTDSDAETRCSTPTLLAAMDAILGSDEFEDGDEDAVEIQHVEKQKKTGMLFGSFGRRRPSSNSSSSSSSSSNNISSSKSNNSGSNNSSSNKENNDKHAKRGTRGSAAGAAGAAGAGAGAAGAQSPVASLPSWAAEIGLQGLAVQRGWGNCLEVNV